MWSHFKLSSKLLRYKLVSISQLMINFKVQLWSFIILSHSPLRFTVCEAGFRLSVGSHWVLSSSLFWFCKEMKDVSDLFNHVLLVYTVKVHHHGHCGYVVHGTHTGLIHYAWNTHILVSSFLVAYSQEHVFWAYTSDFLKEPYRKMRSEVIAEQVIS